MISALVEDGCPAAAAQLFYNSGSDCTIPSRLPASRETIAIGGTVMAPSTITKMRFLYNLVYDPEYRGYVVDVPQLPGCMSQGKSVEAALKNVRKAIRLYLKEAGPRPARSVPEVMTGQIEVSFPAWRPT